MLSVEQIVNSLKIKQYTLPKSILLEYDKYEIENEENYLKKIEELDIINENNHLNNKLITTYSSLNDLLGTSFTTFLHIKSNKSLNYRFLDSIFSIIDTSYIMKNNHEKEFIMTQWIKKLDDELLSEEKYYEFNYSKNRKMKRENLLLSINQAYMNKCDYEIFDNFIQYNIDMLNITLFVLNIKNGNIDYNNSKLFHYKNIYNPLNNVAIILYDNGIYYPIIRDKSINNSLFNFNVDSDKSILIKLYRYMNINNFNIKNIIEDIYKNNIQQEINKEEKVDKEEDINIDKEEINKEEINKEEINKEEINKEEINKEEKVDKEEDINIDKEDINNEEKVDKEEKIKYDIKKLEKMKIDEIKMLCISENIILTKKSEKTNKDINKLKNELINDLISL